MSGELSADDVRAMLENECREVGGQTAWAELHDVSPAYVCDVLAKRREPGKAILAGLGLVRIVNYASSPPGSMRAG